LILFALPIRDIAVSSDRPTVDQPASNSPRATLLVAATVDQPGEANVARWKAGSNAIRCRPPKKLRRAIERIVPFPNACAPAWRPVLRRSHGRQTGRSDLPGGRRPETAERLKKSRPEPVRVVFFSIVCQSWRRGIDAGSDAGESVRPGRVAFVEFFADSQWNAGTSYLHTDCSRFRPGNRSSTGLRLPGTPVNFRGLGKIRSLKQAQGGI